MKEQEQNLNSRANFDFQGISEKKMKRRHGELNNLGELYDQKLEEFIATIKAIIILIENNAGSGAKYMTRTLTTLATSFYELFQRVDSVYAGDHRFELYVDYDDISYQVGKAEKLMFVYEIAAEENLEHEAKQLRKKLRDDLATVIESWTSNQILLMRVIMPS